MTKCIFTGVAGFVGHFTAMQLAERGWDIVGIDSLDPYYDISLKHARLKRLQDHVDNNAKQGKFAFHQIDIADSAALKTCLQDHQDAEYIVHFAAQAGVRYSVENPAAYIRSNIVGHSEMLEVARNLPHLKHFVYASSSSVYGGNTKLPFSIDDRVDKPVSLYAATKRSVEHLSYSYSHMYDIPATGLRFFTAYGPFGRPDMAYFMFSQKILAGEIIPVFNHGKMERDFTYIDDIVNGILAAIDRPPTSGFERTAGRIAPHQVFNLGNNKSESLLDFIAILEENLGKKAKIELRPMPVGDIVATCADITSSVTQLGFQPKTSLREGLEKFVRWYKEYYGVIG